jgi:hypothetical protein
METSNITAQQLQIVERLVELENLQASRGKNSIRFEEQIDLHEQLIKLSLQAIRNLYVTMD